MANKRLIDSGSPYLFFVTRIDEMPAFSDSEIEEIFSGTGVVGMTVHPINRRTPSGMDMTRFDFTWPGHAKPTSLYLASTFDGKIVSAVL